MDDSINEFARNLLARAKARDEGILKRHDNHAAVPSTPTASAVSEFTKVNTTTSVMEADPPNRNNKENLETTEMELDDEEDEEVSYEENEPQNDQVMEQDDSGDEEDDNGNEEESEESEDDQEETQDNKEGRDELVPLSLLACKPLSRMGEGKCPQSASPISRKNRLSALAQSINSWEDDLGTPPKKEAADYTTTTTSGGKKKGPRFSISTPPPPTTRLASAQANKRNSCHQFIATATSTSVSPVKRSPQDASSPAKTPISGPASGNSSFSSVLSLSPAKKSLNSSPIKAVSSLLQSPAIASPEMKITRSPVKNVKFENNDRKLASPSRPNLPINAVSPVKPSIAGPGSAPDVVTKNLEMQGFVKVDPTQGPTTSAPKSSITGSILNKKRMFEKDVDASAVPPAPKVSKIASGPSWPLVTAASSSNQPACASSNATSASLTPLQQFHSRKSLQVDPSELSVAQKARLFERQQKEQEELRSKEQETNKWLNRGPTNRVNATAAPQPSKVQKAQSPSKVQKAQSPSKVQKAQSPSKAQPELELTENKPKYYFGQDSTIPPPPPPLPQTSASSPSKTKAASPVKTVPVEENHEDSKNVDSNSEDDELNCSPSMLIAKSVKPIRRVVTKDDKMYPSLTDLENNTETEDNETNTSSVGSSPVASCSFNSSMSTSSLGSFIQTKAQCTTMNSEINTTMACQQIDDLIDQALEGQYVDDTFMMEGAVPLQSSSPIVKHMPQPLVHSVSVYRKNQQQQKKAEGDSATFKIPQNLEILEEENEEDKEALHDKIQTLEQQVLIQQKAIAQASKLLSVCESSFEFNNSTENIEGERVLLIASQKRSQLLSFISKLRSGKNVDGGGVSPSKDTFKPSSSIRGVMKIDSLQLYPVKSARLHQDYVYHFIMILKYNEQVFATTTVKTSASNTCIEFPNEFVIPELDPGFRVQVEVYALRTFKQMDVPHNMKYHIKNPLTSQSSSSTPSKGSTLSNFLTPTRSSKHTPKATDLKSTPSSGAAMATFNSIRTSNFTLQAVLNLNLSNLNKTEWEMSMVNSSLILPNISMSIKCNNKNELNFRGFLTVFSDVSGLGAWHRRWAMLDEDFRLLFWTYPEDEAQKPPVHVVELSSCITPRIAPAARDVCARPHTFLLVTTREPLPTDANSLVVSVHEKYTAIKNMFSADNRSERDAWIAVINKALTNMRAWGINEPKK